MSIDREAAIREALDRHPKRGAAHEALDALLAELAAAREQIVHLELVAENRLDLLNQARADAAREREQQWAAYAHHIPGCSYNRTGECDCGLRELEQARRELLRLAATGGHE